MIVGSGILVKDLHALAQSYSHRFLVNFLGLHTVWLFLLLAGFHAGSVVHQAVGIRAAVLVLTARQHRQLRSPAVNLRFVTSADQESLVLVLEVEVAGHAGCHV